MIITNECNQLLFEHYVGSKLIDNCTIYSDIDLFRVYKNDIVIVKPGTWENFMVMDVALNCFSDPSLHYAKTSENSTANKTDITSISILSLLNELTCHKIDDIGLLSKILSHLYAVKYNLILEVKDQELYNLYMDWLKTPGISGIFWNKLKEVFWETLNALPDKDKNWSQEFDGSEEHIQMKNQWMKYIKVYPVVDKKIGYDTLNSKRIIQDIMIAICVLTADRMITDEERQYLNKIKEGSLSVEDYKLVKIHVWKQFRLVQENMFQSYYLGHGYCIEEAKQKNMYGVESFFNFISKVSSTKVLSIDNNLNAVKCPDLGS